MKKLLLLGGSPQQVIAIEKAKQLGYYTVLCDYLPDNPGQYAAHKFYPVSTTDRQAVLEVARREQAQGVLAYASDPAAPTAAFVAQEMGLPGNPLNSVEILCNKDKFRAFLRENGFHTPLARGYGSVEEAQEDLTRGYFPFPVLVKPVDSSGSKGVSVLFEAEHAKPALENALSFSRSGRILVEEYIEKAHPYLIGGDILVADGKIVLWGLLNCHRDPRANPLVPAGKSYPPALTSAVESRVKETLQNLVSCLHVQNCCMNVELVADKQNRVFPLNIGPRCGGNMIPDLLECIFGVHTAALSVQMAMGQPICINASPSPDCFATYNLHSTGSGILKEFYFDKKAKNHVFRKCFYKQPGDRVDFFDNASKALGIVFLRFQTPEETCFFMDHAGEHIQAVLV